VKILIADAFNKGLPERLEKFGEVFDDAGRIAGADVILVRSKTRHPRILVAVETAGAVERSGSGNGDGSVSENGAGQGHPDTMQATEMKRLAGLIRNAADRVGVPPAAELAQMLEEISNCSPEERRREGRTHGARDVGGA